ncbi:MAG: M28 family metallopeptidase, partial [Candidatus Aminicenantales bacterium]
MKRNVLLFTLAVLGLGLTASLAPAQPAEGIPRTILPLSVLKDIINEASGDLALQNEIYLSGVNRNRLPEEYVNGYFETKFILDRLHEYGISDCRIIDLPTDGPLTWDAESGELWIVKPALRKIADLKDIAASLCSGSATMDVTAALVYVGPGNQEKYYAGKDVKGKIVLVNGSPGWARRLAVDKFGAAGIVAYDSSHPEFDPDEVGWEGLGWDEGAATKTIGFMISKRQGTDLRDQLERGIAVEVRAKAVTSMVPYKEQMVEAWIAGTEIPDEELVFSAHVSEGWAKQGANDNVSGCVSLLETARTLHRLIADKKIPPPRRSVRFVFVPEISGTMDYLKMFPDVAARFFADINEDMVGEGLIKNQSMLTLVQTPWSMPSYLNDVVAEIYEWVGTTQRNNEGAEAYLPIWGAAGSRDPFYYVLDPFSGGSDHVIFISDAHVPAILMCVWPDQWYHTSGDTPDKSDATQLKRAVFIGAASAVFLAGAGPAEAETLISEVGGRALDRIGRAKIKAERMVRDAASERLFEVYKTADNYAAMSLAREIDTLESVRFFVKGESDLEARLEAGKKALADFGGPIASGIEALYADRCREKGISPKKIELSPEEIRLTGIIPVPTALMKPVFDERAFSVKRREAKDIPSYNLLRAEREVRSFIDGKRSILQIRNAVSAEMGSVGL